MGKRKRRVLEYLKEHQPASVEEMMDEFGISKTSVRSSLSRLCEEGLVYRPRWGKYALDGWNHSAEEVPAALEGNFTHTAEFGDPNLIELASVLNRWLANYTGPSNDPVAVEIVLSFEHLKRAIELRDERLLPLLEESLKNTTLVS